MRQALLLVVAGLLLACLNDTNFTRQEDDVDVVSGNGEMLLEPDTVDLWGLTAEITASQTLTVQNIGDNNLVIYEARIITSGDGTFYLPEEWRTAERTIAPNLSLPMIVAATLAAEGSAEGTLRIKSNDVNELEQYITLFATTEPAATDSGS